MAKKSIIHVALTQYGIQEYQGPVEHNPEILKYFLATNHNWIKTDETAWCSAFINWVAMAAGYKRTGELNARSWLKVGVKTNNPEQGSIVVLWRDDPLSWKGHVGIFIRKDNEYIWLLGGNQSNQVCIASYPVHRLLEYRNLQKS